MKPGKRARADWIRLAERRLAGLIDRARAIPALREMGPRKVSGWKVSVELAGSLRMTRLNSRFRGKARATDVLSFPSPDVFRVRGYLGELVLCLPVLKRQAKELGHSPEQELELLLAHGLLHLLGLDHERGAEEARRMAGFEERLLGGPRRSGRLRFRGLIARSG